MQIPIALYTAMIAGTFAAYIAILTSVLHCSKEQETEFSVTILNVKIRQSIEMNKFVETERDKTEAADKSGLDQRIKSVMKEMWENIRSCYRGDNLLNILDRRELQGKVLCIFGILCVIISGIFYLCFNGQSENRNMNLIQISVVFGLLYVPLIVVAYLVVKNIFICRKIRSLRKELDKIWDFTLVETPKNS
jgi:hypothetical protein